MLCTLFTTYLENRPMRLHDIARSAARARKAYARTTAMQADDVITHKAAKRLERRTKAARRALLESQRAADAWGDWADA